MTTTVSSGHTARHQHHIHPVVLKTPSNRLGPEKDFPEDLAGLSMADLQVLHSRITHRLDCRR